MIAVYHSRGKKADGTCISNPAVSCTARVACSEVHSAVSLRDSQLNPHDCHIALFVDPSMLFKELKYF